MNNGAYDEVDHSYLNGCRSSKPTSSLETSVADMIVADRSTAKTLDQGIGS
jgi:hypothetical protein